MNFQTTTRTAKALGGIAWAFDTVIRVTTKYTSKALDKIQNRPIYSVCIDMNDNIICEFHGINMKKVCRTVEQFHDLDNVIIMIRRTK